VIWTGLLLLSLRLRLTFLSAAGTLRLSNLLFIGSRFIQTFDGRGDFAVTNLCFVNSTAELHTVKWEVLIDMEVSNLALVNSSLQCTGEGNITVLADSRPLNCSDLPSVAATSCGAYGRNVGNPTSRLSSILPPLSSSSASTGPAAPPPAATPSPTPATATHPTPNPTATDTATTPASATAASASAATPSSGSLPFTITVYQDYELHFSGALVLAGPVEFGGTLTVYVSADTVTFTLT
jgi:hypothetical protein